MDAPSQNYQDVTRRFRDHAAAEKMKFVAHPTTVSDIQEAERALGTQFPESYRWFQLEFGDVEWAPIDIYSVRLVVSEYGVNIVAENQKARTEFFPPLPVHLIAFSDDGGGDYVCFDTSRQESNEYSVVWWYHDLDENQEPEEAGSSFLDWIDSELRELGAEQRGSLLDNLPYKQWIDTWTRQFGGRPDDPNEGSR